MECEICCSDRVMGNFRQCREGHLFCTVCILAQVSPPCPCLAFEQRMSPCREAGEGDGVRSGPPRVPGRRVRAGLQPRDPRAAPAPGDGRHPGGARVRLGPFPHRHGEARKGRECGCVRRWRGRGWGTSSAAGPAPGAPCWRRRRRRTRSSSAAQTPTTLSAGSATGPGTRHISEKSLSRCSYFIHFLELNCVPLLSCDEAAAAVDAADAARLRLEEALTAAVLRQCHRCGLQFQKVVGCNSMTCRCGAHSCYLCRQPVISYYDHFCSFVHPSRSHSLPLLHPEN